MGYVHGGWRGWLSQQPTFPAAQFKFDRALRALGPAAAALPSYGVGHGLGSLLHLLISARYAVTVRPRLGGACLVGPGTCIAMPVCHR